MQASQLAPQPTQPPQHTAATIMETHPGSGKDNVPVPLDPEEGGVFVNKIRVGGPGAAGCCWLQQAVACVPGTQSLPQASEQHGASGAVHGFAE